MDLSTLQRAQRLISADMHEIREHIQSAGRTAPNGFAMDAMDDLLKSIAAPITAGLTEVIRPLRTEIRDLHSVIASVVGSTGVTVGETIIPVPVALDPKTPVSKVQTVPSESAMPTGRSVPQKIGTSAELTTLVPEQDLITAAKGKSEAGGLRQWAVTLQKEGPLAQIAGWVQGFNAPSSSRQLAPGNGTGPSKLTVATAQLAFSSSATQETIQQVAATTAGRGVKKVENMSLKDERVRGAYIQSGAVMQPPELALTGQQELTGTSGNGEGLEVTHVTRKARAGGSSSMPRPGNGNHVSAPNNGAQAGGDAGAKPWSGRRASTNPSAAGRRQNRDKGPA